MAKNELGHEYLLTGDIEKIRDCAAQNGISLEGLELVEAPQVMEMEDDAKLVLKQKANSSMGVGLRLVADGKADAFVTAGPTGAALMGGTMIVKRIKGVKRPALGTVAPGTEGRRYLLIDCGANVECRPEMLEQFAVIGSVYMQRMYGVERPSVGLANNGVEETKGTELQLAAWKLLSGNDRINFAGNAEARDIPTGQFDVVVADGFTGNIILKTMEGAAGLLFGIIKETMMKNAATKAAGLLLKPAFRKMRDSFSHEKVGGAPIIGLNRPVDKAHGSSGANAFKNAVSQVIKWGESGVTEAIAEALR
jgi:glycerol-3-phosphate acyltransferase PlsX